MHLFQDIKGYIQFAYKAIKPPPSYLEAPTLQMIDTKVGVDYILLLSFYYLPAPTCRWLIYRLRGLMLAQMEHASRNDPRMAQLSSWGN